MFCPGCGNECDDSKQFCQHCGTKLTAGNPVAEGVPNSGPEFFSVLSPTYAKMKRLASSPLFMTAIISYTAYLVLTLLSAVNVPFLSPFVSLERLLNLLLSNFSSMGLPREIYSVFGILQRAAMTSGLIAALPTLIPGALICVGMWLMFASARQGKPKSTGLTMIKVITIIQLIFACGTYVAVLAVEVIAWIGIVGLLEYAGSGSIGVVIAIMVGVTLLTGAVIALNIIYYVKLFKTFTVIKYAVDNDFPVNNVRQYVVVFCWINAIGSLGNGIAGIALAVSNICFGLFLPKYRKEMIDALKLM